ncbi:MAG: hypothetical protein L6R38_000906 [Xanthoria sp. 2 TBL-2021]|nr:MAG: hypothetical protein L6R38_000906 [Xanthoria sp. 2 TBL-2021]
MKIKPLSSNRIFISEDNTNASQAQRANRTIAESTLHDFSDSELQEVRVWSRPQGPDSRYDMSLTRDVEQMYHAQIRRGIKTCPEKKNKKAKVAKKKDSQGFLYLSKLPTANSHSIGNAPAEDATDQEMPDLILNSLSSFGVPIK